MIVDYVAERVLREKLPEGEVQHLDIGAGWGHLVDRLRKSIPGLKSSGCDYNPGHCEVPDLKVQHVDLNKEGLPFPDASFNLVTCTEVVEHLENFRHALREAARVSKPGALIVLSTPNVLTLKSRLVYLTRGFYSYFDPLPRKDHPHIYPGQRHITPIPFFYLAHGLVDAGFEDIKPYSDKTQKSSSRLLWLFLPFFRLFESISKENRERHYGKHHPLIENLATLNNSWPVLTGRTLIVTARRCAYSDQPPAVLESDFKM